MIQIEPVDLPRQADQGPQCYQAEVNAEGEYALQVETAALKFVSYNRKTNAVFVTTSALSYRANGGRQ